MAALLRTLAAATLALGTATALAPPAQAHDPDTGTRAYTIALTDRAAATLAENNVTVQVTGPAEAKTLGDRTVLSFPVADSSSSRLGHHRSRVVLLEGGVTFAGAATESWTELKINKSRNRITALVDGERETVLRFGRGGCGGFPHLSSVGDGGRYDGRGRHRGALRLSAAGADSLNRAAGADAFEPGDKFARAVR